MKTLLAIAAAAVLIIGLDVRAQTPETPAPTQPKINLTLEQRHIIKEIVKDLKIAPAPAKQDITPGTEVTSTIKPEPMPAHVSATAPTIEPHPIIGESRKPILAPANDR